MASIVYGAHNVVHTVLRKDVMASIFCEALITTAEAVDVLKGLGRVQSKFIWANPDHGTVAFMKFRDVKVCTAAQD